MATLAVETLATPGTLATPEEAGVADKVSSLSSNDRRESFERASRFQRILAESSSHQVGFNPN
jgi:hypothetical protein